MRISDWSSDVCSSDLALRPRNLTLEAWLKPDEGGGTYQGALFKASSSAWTDGYGLVRVGDSIRFFIDNWTETYVEAPLAIGSWQPVAATYDGAALRLYLDGATVAEQAHSSEGGGEGKRVSVRGS